MRVAINQETVYRYRAETNYSIQYLRLCPISGAGQRVLIRAHERREQVLRDAGIADLHTLRFGGFFDLGTRRRFAAHVQAFAPDVVLTWMSRATRHAPASKVPASTPASTGAPASFTLVATHACSSASNTT